MTYLPISTPVRMTEIAFKHTRPAPGYITLGVVVGFGRSPGVVIVQRVGRKNREAWNKIYWEPIMKPEDIVKRTIEAFVER